MDDMTAPPGESPGENPVTAGVLFRHLERLDRLGRPTFADVDTEIGRLARAITESLGPLRTALAGIGAAMVAGIAPLIRFAAEVEMANARAFVIYGEDYVVDRMGISRVDIRVITYREVRLWNYRRVPLDILDVVEYAAMRAGSRRP